MTDTTTLVATRRAKSDVARRYLSHQITEWLDRCDKKDERRQHVTQLAAIRSLLTRISDRLEADYKSLSAAGSTNGFFAAAASFDVRVVWLERLWRFFEGKFAQREEGSPFRSVLLLADEVVWSCYSQVFDRARALHLKVAEGMAPPLPFVEARYSPAAFPTELVPPDLRGEVETAFLSEFLNKMPIPVVRIPPSSVPTPWWLVLLGHEVGHHLQYDLLPDKKLVDGFSSAIHQAVERETGSTSEADTWARWSREIFADVFSALCMGPWAVRTILELEFMGSAAMDKPRDSYPSPTVRLGLLAGTVDRVTGSTRGTQELGGLVAWDPTHPVHKAVLDVALGELPGVSATLPALCDLGVAGFASDIESWRETFCGTDDRVPDRATRSARILVSAAFAAWEKIAVAKVDEALETARKNLCSRATAAILLGAPEGERGAEEAIIDETMADEVVDAIWRETA